MIYEIRGQKVMLDFQITKIYGYSAKAFNQQVKNNIDKFPERYRFQLSKCEVDWLVRSKFLPLNFGLLAREEEVISHMPLPSRASTCL